MTDLTFTMSEKFKDKGGDYGKRELRKLAEEVAWGTGKYDG